MTDSLQPVATSTDHVSIPRTQTHDQMREHLDHGRAQTLSSHDRHRMFVRHDGTWAIGGTPTGPSRGSRPMMA